MPPGQRNLVYAFDRCFEVGSCSLQKHRRLPIRRYGDCACLFLLLTACCLKAPLQGAVAACASPLVGALAERIFGFSGSGTGELAGS